jgi:twinkle protein
MTVVTWPTGSGKTTFLSQLSPDLAEQGVYTLWVTFEILNKRLLKKLLHQYCRDPLALPPNVHNKGEKMVELVNNLAYRFEALPPYFLKFHGTAELENAPDAMDYATYATAGT